MKVQARHYGNRDVISKFETQNIALITLDPPRAAGAPAAAATPTLGAGFAGARLADCERGRGRTDRGARTRQTAGPARGTVPPLTTATHLGEAYSPPLGGAGATAQRGSLGSAPARSVARLSRGRPLSRSP